MRLFKEGAGVGGGGMGWAARNTIPTLELKNSIILTVSRIEIVVLEMKDIQDTIL